MLVPAVFYTYLMVPKHVIEDEAYYQLAAQNILTAGPLGNFPKSAGWVFLIFLGDLFGGINNYVSIHISELLGAGSIVGIFFLAVWAGLSLWTAFISALLFTVIPARMFWAATGESHTASIFFVIWAAAFSFLLYRNANRDIFWLAISVWVFAALVRSETVLLFLFFLMCIGLFVPKHLRKELPFSDALCWAAVILMPSMILGVRHVFFGHWAVTGSNVSVNNFLQNASSYGVGFLTGRLHPVLFTLAAMLGLAVIYRRDKKVAVVLSGWFILLSLTYFSMWFQDYGETRGMFFKTRLFVFFYPPMVLCAAGGLVWMADRYAFGYKTLAAAVLCGIMIAGSFFYYNNYPLGQDKFVLEMRLVEDVGQMATAQDMTVACFPEEFTGVLPSFMATDIAWFLQEPLWRQAAFKQARKVYLVDDIFSQRRCQGAVSLIKEQGKAVLVKQWIQGSTRFGVYSLSGF
jgi:hypothetical protein